MKYGEWTFWAGEGEPPTGTIQAWFYNDTMKDAKRNTPTQAEMYNWSIRSPVPRACDIIAYRKVIEPVREVVREVVNCDVIYRNLSVWKCHPETTPSMIISITLVDGEPDKTVAPVARWAK